MSKMRVPFVDLGRQNGSLAAEILPAVEAVLRRGDFILGTEVERFEDAFSDRVGRRFAVATNSGLDSLWLTLEALGIGPGCEVITVPNSYIATTAAIGLAGATPVFADVTDDENIDPTAIERLITERTRAILPVHLRGRPCQMQAIVEVAQRHQLHVIEDCAQAIDARSQGRKVGTFGIAGCFSLHPLKNLGGCGDGGIIVTDDEDLSRSLRSARNHGLRAGDHSRNPCLFWGHNSRLDTIGASILNIKLAYLDQRTTRHVAIAQRYMNGLSHLPLGLPNEHQGELVVYQAFVIQARERTEMQAFLEAQGVQTKVQYPIPIHLQPAAQYLGYVRGDLPVAERLADCILSLPIYAELTDEEVNYVVDSIGAFFESQGRRV